MEQTIKQGITRQQHSNR